MPEVAEREHYMQAGRLKAMMAVYDDAQDLINIGAYKAGSNPEIDTAIKHIKPINTFLQQEVADGSPFDLTIKRLMEI
jgi:flagellum-specific ATP synthase